MQGAYSRRDDRNTPYQEPAIRRAFGWVSREHPVILWTAVYAVFTAVMVFVIAGVGLTPLQVAGTVTLVLLTLQVVCMATHRGGWSPLWRVLYVPLSFVVYNYVLVGVASAIVGWPLMRRGAWEWAHPLGGALASVAAAAHAIRQSRLFGQRGIRVEDGTSPDNVSAEPNDTADAELTEEPAPSAWPRRLVANGPLAGIVTRVSREGVRGLAAGVTRRRLILAYLAAVLLMTAYVPMQIAGASGAKAGVGYAWIWQQGSNRQTRWQRPDMGRWAMQVVGLSAAFGFVLVLRRERSG
ncbi:hypothetical protein HN371_27665 [Candidatus Poribacteria bacterium]|jgi:hypothetical protein|nr:hypothetical protein [Candidatus Poribacteria bacterium]MBT5533709.1 hypothetical protein [Candidatus Poribacteria bacterium]MBT7095939.1 hypothetical protein [Candidatus Poribacteria bacterium]MBT7807938.1 hypothetical protein [Candidatus Poribacteria bacterium]